MYKGNRNLDKNRNIVEYTKMIKDISEHKMKFTFASHIM